MALSIFVYWLRWSVTLGFLEWLWKNLGLCMELLCPHFAVKWHKPSPLFFRKDLWQAQGKADAALNLGLRPMRTDFHEKGDIPIVLQDIVSDIELGVKHLPAITCLLKQKYSNYCSSPGWKMRTCFVEGRVDGIEWFWLVPHPSIGWNCCAAPARRAVESLASHPHRSPLPLIKDKWWTIHGSVEHVKELVIKGWPKLP